LGPGEDSPMNFTHIMDVVSRVFAAIGVAVLVIGFLTALAAAGVALARGRGEVYRTIRRQFGRSILLGLEILVAADLIRTVAVEPTIRNVLILGGIVVIRTILSFSLEVEVEGVWPWRRWTLRTPDASESEQSKSV
jgi:uncharacterized membrane protein